MTYENLRRVIWLLKERSISGEYLKLKQVRLAIMKEIGTDERTIKATLKKLKELGWLKRLNYHHFEIAGDWE
jgi:predicted transcriptional regulator|tara:strand:- start:666 stop:881 length:216 start_codon:yes stop_codon:yes gene_type:complete